MADLTPSRPTVTFITGGARSGKSAYAVQLAKRATNDVCYLATAEPIDDEMRSRIATHKAERPDSWQTIEEPLHLAGALEREAGLGSTVIVDCVTVWLGNMLDHHANASAEDLHAAVITEIDRLEQVAEQLNLIAISNEVGSGIVPADSATRLYRDLLGEVNQRLAALSDFAILMVSGLPMALRTTAHSPEL